MWTEDPEKENLFIPELSLSPTHCPHSVKCLFEIGKSILRGKVICDHQRPVQQKQPSLHPKLLNLPRAKPHRWSFHQGAHPAPYSLLPHLCPDMGQKDACTSWLFLRETIVLYIGQYKAIDEGSNRSSGLWIRDLISSPKIQASHSTSLSFGFVNCEGRGWHRQSQRPFPHYRTLWDSKRHWSQAWWKIF